MSIIDYRLNAYLIFSIIYDGWYQIICTCLPLPQIRLYVCGHLLFQPDYGTTNIPDAKSKFSETL